MSAEYNEPETISQQNRDGLSIISESSVPTGCGSLPQKVMQCAACLQQTEYTDDHAYCEICGAGLGSLIYSGHEPALVTGNEVYLMTPPVRTVDKRRHPRIPCKSVRACIKTEQGASIIVDVVSIGRGGVRFTSFEKFSLGTPISIAIYYVEGGQNIFQDGRIIRVQRRASGTRPNEYAIEFSVRKRLSQCTEKLSSGKVSS